MAKNTLTAFDKSVLTWVGGLLMFTAIHLGPGVPAVVGLIFEKDAPAWIQAFGSIGAIIAALLVVNRQHVLELRRKEASELHGKLSLVKGAYQLVDGVYQLARKFESMTVHNSTSNDLKRSAADIGRFVRALSRVDHLRFDFPEAIGGVLCAESAGTYLAGILEELQPKIAMGNHQLWVHVSAFGEQAAEEVKPALEELKVKLIELEQRALSFDVK